MLFQPGDPDNPGHCEVTQMLDIDSIRSVLAVWVFMAFLTGRWIATAIIPFIGLYGALRTPGGPKKG